MDTLFACSYSTNSIETRSFIFRPSSIQLHEILQHIPTYLNAVNFVHTSAFEFTINSNLRPALPSLREDFAPQ